MGLAGILIACGKPHAISIVPVYVLEDRTITIEDKHYFNFAEARAAMQRIEAERPDARFSVSVTNMSESEGVSLIRKLSNGDGKIGLVGILTEPKAIKN
jgi:hypothetical protein